VLPAREACMIESPGRFSLRRRGTRPRGACGTRTFAFGDKAVGGEEAGFGDGGADGGGVRGEVEKA